jgi:hypothetical protein
LFVLQKYLHEENKSELNQNKRVRAGS